MYSWEDRDNDEYRQYYEYTTGNEGKPRVAERIELARSDWSDNPAQTGNALGQPERLALCLNRTGKREEGRNNRTDGSIPYAHQAKADQQENQLITKSQADQTHGKEEQASQHNALLAPALDKLPDESSLHNNDDKAYIGEDVCILRSPPVKNVLREEGEDSLHGGEGNGIDQIYKNQSSQYAVMCNVPPA